MLRMGLGVLALVAVPLAQATDGETLFKSKPCVACHSVANKMLGPALKDVAAKYAGNANAAEQLAKRIKSGSSSQWGTIPMPPNQVTDEEASILANWVLAQ